MKANKRIKRCFFFALLFTVFACQPSSTDSDTEKERSLYLGGDISWLPQMENTGYLFFDDNGQPEDCFKILKDHGFNSVRLRTWVNPSDDPHSGHCSKEETVAMAVRAKKWGMNVMINFLLGTARSTFMEPLRTECVGG